MYVNVTTLFRMFLVVLAKTCSAFVAAPPVSARSGGVSSVPFAASGRGRVNMVAAEASTGQQQLEKLKFLTPEVPPGFAWCCFLFVV